MRISLSDSAKFDLEKRFENFFYKDLCLGRVIKSYFSVTLGIGFSEVWRGFIHWLWLIVFGPFHKGEKYGRMKPGGVLFALYCDVERNNQMMFPIARQFKPYERRFLFSVSSSARHLKDDEPWCTIPWACGKNTFRSRVNYLKDVRKIASIYNGWREANGLPWHTILPFVFGFAFTYVYRDGFESFLRKSMPSCIVVDYEHNSVWATLVHVARGMGIRTVTLMHGEIYSSYGWTPVLADKVAVWGEGQKRQLISFGVNKDCIAVCGCSRVNTNDGVDVKEVRSRLKLDAEKPIALLATNPILISDRLELVNAFGEALKDVTTIQGVVRLHPSENLDVYKDAIEGYPHLRFYSAKVWSVAESIAVSTVVVNHDSTFGDEALVYGKPVVEINVLESELTNGQKLVDNAGCPCCRNPFELTLELKKLVDDVLYREEVLNRAKPFVEDLFVATGDEAAAKTADAIRKVIQV